jgi:hypothetical protein
MPSLKSILVVGSTGAIGRDLSMALAEQRDSFPRIGVFHDISRPTDSAKQNMLETFQASGLEVVRGNGYGSSEPFEGFDCVVICLGNHALHEQPEIIDSAIKAGVRHFYPSEYGADLLVGENWSQRYYRYKVLTREHLEKRSQEVPDLGWTYFVLGRFTEWAVISHFGIDNKNSKARIYGTSAGRQSLLSVSDSIKYLIETLKDPLPDIGSEQGTTKGRRRTYRMHGHSPTYGEIFDIWERVTGKKYEVTYLDVEGATQERREAIREGDVDKELAASHKFIQGSEGTLLPKPWDNERFPWIQPQGLEEALSAAVKTESYRKFFELS